MEKKCCEIKVSEMEDGFRIEITGAEVKEKCKSAMENCCSGESMKKCFQSFCGTGKGEACCCC